MSESKLATPKAAPIKVALPRPLRLAGVDYAMYEKLRDAPGNRGFRMTFIDGVLWLMSPEFIHESGARWIDQIVWTYSEVTGLDGTPAGATTFRKPPGEVRSGVGKEGDNTYYLGKLAAEVRQKATLNLEIDPPPSLWIEVDNRGNSRGKLPLYAELGVPEVWQYRVRRRKLSFWRLGDGVYTEIPASLAVPGLTPAMVLELLDEARVKTRPEWIKWMRSDWFARNRALFPDFQNQQP